MWIVWITVSISILIAFAILISLLPAFRSAPLNWRLLSTSGIPLSILGINFVLRFWQPTAGAIAGGEGGGAGAGQAPAAGAGGIITG